MTRIREVKTNFTAGEISADLLGRGDLRAYDNGALDLCNSTSFHKFDFYKRKKI